MKTIIIISALTLIGFLFVACNDKIEVQQNYDFTLSTMPVQKQIAKGETAEIRCQLNRSGRYDGAKYFIRYFQPDGAGTLTDENGTVFQPNDSYPLEVETFRLYYTSQCTDAQQIDIVVTDNFGSEYELSIKFQNKQ